MSDLQKEKARQNIVLAQAARARNVGPVTARFWSKVDIRGSDECWPWKAAPRNKNEGYGAFWFEGRHQPAGRIAWVLTYGPLVEHREVCHRCDNPPCCNPAHLFLGTRIENNNDKVVKQRHAFGSRNGIAKLTEAEAVEIKRLKPIGRAPYGYRTKIAERFNVRPGTVTDLWTRSWKHLN